MGNSGCEVLRSCRGRKPAGGREPIHPIAHLVLHAFRDFAATLSEIIDFRQQHILLAGRAIVLAALRLRY